MTTSSLVEIAAVAAQVARDRADVCVVWRVSADESLEPIAFAARDTDAEVLLREMLRVEPRAPNAFEQTAIVARRPAVAHRTSLAAKRNVPHEYWPYMPRYGLRCAIVAPVVHGDVVVGLLSASRNDPDAPFSAEDAHAFGELSASLASDPVFLREP